jgi:hypothetical protein
MSFTSAKAILKAAWPDGAAQASNLPSLGLPDLTGFEGLYGVIVSR